MDECFDYPTAKKRSPQRGEFYIEGHKSKENWEDENTMVFQTEAGLTTLEEATARAKDYFEKEKDLGLTVIYQQDDDGTKEGIKIIFRNDEGELEESCLFY
ncbi:MAG: hypothetical protein AB1715_09765 [Acidobacteriota bacterium]